MASGCRRRLWARGSSLRGRRRYRHRQSYSCRHRRSSPEQPVEHLTQQK